MSIFWKSENFMKISKFSKDCQKLSQMSCSNQWLVIFFQAMNCFMFQNQKVTHSLTDSLSDKVTYWAVRWQLKKISRLRRWNDKTFGPFHNFPKLKICWITWENYQKQHLFSKIWLRKRLKWSVIFFRKWGFIFQKFMKTTKKI